MITVTENAKKQMNHVAIKNDAPYVRYSLNGGGCSGLIGKWQIEYDLEVNDEQFDIGDNKFFLIDKFTMEQLENATIDYAGEFMPSFKVTIPGTASCGCGESFMRNQ